MIANVIKSSNRGGAVFSVDGMCRYMLWRDLTGGKMFEDNSNGKIVFVMLNPSTADHGIDDPTIRRCMQYGRVLCCSRLEVVNLFARVTSDPNGIMVMELQEEELVDDYIKKAIWDAKYVICAWGSFGGIVIQNRAARVKNLLKHWSMENGVRLFALKINMDGSPAHPLYQKKINGVDELVEFNPAFRQG